MILASGRGMREPEEEDYHSDNSSPAKLILPENKVTLNTSNTVDIT
ncbi:hypothetical protein NDI36_03770 [Leptolyngbya boryana FACHB-1624]|nr:hypothetical protein [Leptolyngbya sp. FACHB-1624]